MSFPDPRPAYMDESLQILKLRDVRFLCMNSKNSKDSKDSKNSENLPLARHLL